MGVVIRHFVYGPPCHGRHTVGRAAAPLSHPSRRQGWTAVAGTGAGSMRVTVGLSHVQRACSHEALLVLLTARTAVSGAEAVVLQEWRTSVRIVMYSAHVCRLKQP